MKKIIFLPIIFILISNSFAEKNNRKFNSNRRDSLIQKYEDNDTLKSVINYYFDNYNYYNQELKTSIIIGGLSGIGVILLGNSKSAQGFFLSIFLGSATYYCVISAGYNAIIQSKYNFQHLKMILRDYEYNHLLPRKLSKKRSFRKYLN